MKFKITDELFFSIPTWENECLATENISKICRERAGEIYGGMHSVADRLDYELLMMEKTGTGFYFMILKEIVSFSKELGYPVLASGSLSGSLISYLLGITETNPLPSHYRCDSECYRCLQKGSGCRFGVDMPDNYCETCKMLMLKEGFDISAISAWSSFAEPVAPDFSLGIAPSVKNQLKDRLNQRLGYADSDLTTYKCIELYDSQVCEDIGRLAEITGKTPENKQYCSDVYSFLIKEFSEEFSNEFFDLNSCSFEMLVKLYGYNTCVFDNSKSLNMLGTDNFFVLRDDLAEKLASFGIPFDLAYGIAGGKMSLAAIDDYSVPEDLLAFLREVKYLPSIGDCISRLNLMCALAWYKINFSNEFASL